MFVCLDCGHVFEWPEDYTETHGLDTPPYEHFSGCPVCGGDYVETVQCDWCGEYITGKFVELSDGTVLCSDCYTERDIANNT